MLLITHFIFSHIHSFQSIIVSFRWESVPGNMKTRSTQAPASKSVVQCERKHVNHSDRDCFKSIAD